MFKELNSISCRVLFSPDLARLLFLTEVVESVAYNLILSKILGISPKTLAYQLMSAEQPQIFKQLLLKFTETQ